jgi:hypothetical protein
MPGTRLRRGSPPAGRGGWLWQGRRVKLADGTTLSGMDSVANQRAYPQPDAQEPGLGFPIVRVLVVFCLATGAAVDAALGRYHGQRTGEAALVRQLADTSVSDEGLKHRHRMKGLRWIAFDGTQATEKGSQTFGGRYRRCDWWGGAGGQLARADSAGAAHRAPPGGPSHRPAARGVTATRRCP